MCGTKSSRFEDICTKSDFARKSQMMVCCLSIRGLSCANNSPKTEGNIREVCSLAVRTFPVLVGSYG